MPNMTGRELAERLFCLRPGIKCLLMSGNTDDGLVYRGGMDQSTFFLQKPFTPEQLSKGVRDVLDQASVTSSEKA
jgi:DNA-binding NarL/FixJ family response regulator